MLRAFPSKTDNESKIEAGASPIQTVAKKFARGIAVLVTLFYIVWYDGAEEEGVSITGIRNENNLHKDDARRV